jgi:hypothetical protein
MMRGRGPRAGRGRKSQAGRKTWGAERDRRHAAEAAAVHLIGRDAREIANGGAGFGAEERVFGFGLGGGFFGDSLHVGTEPAEKPVIDLQAGIVGEGVGERGGGPT